MREGLGPHERIRKKKDFLFLYRKGSRHRGQYFNIVYTSNGLSFSRLGVVVSKKIGNAVTRNKVKRWLRTLFRRNKELLVLPLDMLIIANRDIREAAWEDVVQKYLAALKRIFLQG